MKRRHAKEPPGSYWLARAKKSAQLIALILLIAKCTCAIPSSNQHRGARLFDYDRNREFDLKVTSSQEIDGVIIKDINYAPYDSRHKRIEAYLVTPKRNGRFAGVVFFHWLGRAKSDRTEFLEEAKELAKLGTVSLLIQGFFPWSEPPTEAESDRRQVIDQTIEVRRAVDLLLSQRNVDRRRIAFVGHDYGAMFGAIVSGVEKRIGSYVLMAGASNFGDWSLKYWPATAAKGEQSYRQVMNSVDPIAYVAHASPANLFFQFSTKDRFISTESAKAFVDAAREPKQVKWYDDAVHDLNVAAANNDRREWLIQRLMLRSLTK